MRYRFMRFPGGKPKAVTFSYDDGCRADARLADTLHQYGLKGTFNLNACFGEKPDDWQLSVDEIREHVLANGHEIAVHGERHRANGALTPLEGIREVLNGRLALENTFDRIVRGMAYPDSGITRFVSGMDYARVKQYLTELEIAYARTLGGDNDGFELPADWHAWMPTAHHVNPNVLSYIDAFLALDFSEKAYVAGLRPRLFYLWGHAYEFDRDDNWALLDEICTRLAHQDDIWCATNMEIYEYTKAYESLVFRADGSMVYNPSLQTVWFALDHQTVCIAAGETARLDALTKKTV